MAACEQRWGLKIGAPFADLSFHYAALAVRGDGTTVVVKACSPTNEFTQEAEALRLFVAKGNVASAAVAERLLEHAPAPSGVDPRRVR